MEDDQVEAVPLRRRRVLEARLQPGHDHSRAADRAALHVGDEPQHQETVVGQVGRACGRGGGEKEDERDSRHEPPCRPRSAAHHASVYNAPQEGSPRPLAYQPPAPIQAALDAGRISVEAVDLFRAFARRYAFPLDDFQVDAILAILEGSSVIVSAPTGAGKTLVAEFAIHDALAAKRRVAYTTPLKALSNQKYADFCRQFGVAEVGILTGDVKVNPRAPVLVMTTEILRNMFYTGTLDGLRHVVLDECHYMGDESRGTVWEEIIVNAPKDVTLVALSATVANVREIADWIGLVHRPIHAVIHPHRPVPLRRPVATLAAE